MGRSALAVAFLAACAGPLARLLAGAGGVAGLGSEVSLTALGLLGWVALGGLPQAEERADRAADPGSGPGSGGSGASPGGALGLALPGVALGASLDLAAGRRELEVACTAAFGLAFVWLLASAAERGRGSPWVALAWWLAVPCLAILPAVARWGRGDAALAAASSPLGWVFLRAIGPGRAVSLPWVPLAVAGGLWALARALTTARRPEEGP